MKDSPTPPKVQAPPPPEPPEWAECDTQRFICQRCGGDGFYDYNDGDGSDWGEDCPSEINHLITCRDCGGTGEAK